MYWTISAGEADTQWSVGTEQPADGRFVVHRHRDAQGEHVDVRLECDGYLMGWRVQGAAMETGAWATEKPPHPVAWLDEDGDAVRLDAGTYRWLERSESRRAVALRGGNGERVLELDAVDAPVDAMRAVMDAAQAAGRDLEHVPALIGDGLAARRRAVGRFCGLGRELDGDAFEETVWRRALEGMRLDEVHAQLRAYEVRFDAKYPPAPVSQPEPLPDLEPTRNGLAMAIARGE